MSVLTEKGLIGDCVEKLNGENASLRKQLAEAMATLRGCEPDEQQDRGLLALGKELISLNKQLAEAQAVTVERCALAFRNEWHEALRAGCDTEGAYQCGLEAINSLSADPNFLARKILEARVDTGKVLRQIYHGGSGWPFHSRCERLVERPCPMCDFVDGLKRELAEMEAR